MRRRGRADPPLGRRLAAVEPGATGLRARRRGSRRAARRTWPVSARGGRAGAEGRPHWEQGAAPHTPTLTPYSCAPPARAAGAPPNLCAWPRDARPHVGRRWGRAGAQRARLAFFKVGAGGSAPGGCEACGGQWGSGRGVEPRGRRLKKLVASPRGRSSGGGGGRDAVGPVRGEPGPGTGAVQPGGGPRAQPRCWT